jgi:hypothetical protein
MALSHLLRLNAQPITLHISFIDRFLIRPRRGGVGVDDEHACRDHRDKSAKQKDCTKQQVNAFHQGSPFRDVLKKVFKRN